VADTLVTAVADTLVTVVADTLVTVVVDTLVTVVVDTLVTVVVDILATAADTDDQAMVTAVVGIVRVGAQVGTGISVGTQVGGTRESYSQVLLGVEFTQLEFGSAQLSIKQ
jgi:hypothetical protein